MYKEAAEFARRLDKCARQVKAVETATTGGITFYVNVKINIAEVCVVTLHHSLGRSTLWHYLNTLL